MSSKSNGKNTCTCGKIKSVASKQCISCYHKSQQVHQHTQKTINLHLQGRTVRQIATELGISTQRIRQILTRAAKQ